jgi:protein ImuB
VHHQPVSVAVADAAGRPVRVTARGGVSAPPAMVTIDELAARPQRVQAWAGPWPVEDRWWDAARARRIARFQVLTTEGRLLLLVVERGDWRVAAEWA